MRFKAFISVFLAAGLLSGVSARAESLWGDDVKETDMLTLPVTLKTHGEIAGDRIELGDVFSGLESTQNTQKIANAPACGQEVVLDIAWLQTVAKKYALNWKPETGDKLILKRACREFTRDDILASFKTALKTQHFPENGDIELNRQSLNFMAPKEVDATVSIEDAVYNPNNNTVSGMAVLTENGKVREKKPLNGKIILYVTVPVATKALAKGDVITDGDIVLKKVRSDDATPQKPAKTEDLIGKEVRRGLRAGQTVDISDVRSKLAVLKGKNVDLHYLKGGLSLKTQAKALESGAVGDIIRIQNLQSKTILEGVVIDTDTVSVTGDNKGGKS